MYFLLIGVVVVLMKYLALAPVTYWNWWVVLSPFGMAMVWWAWADKSGYSQRVEMKKLEKRKSDRIQRHRDAMAAPVKKRK